MKKEKISRFQQAMFVYDRLGSVGKLRYMAKKGYNYQLSDLNNEIELDNKFFHWLVDSDLSFDFEDDFLND